MDFSKLKQLAGSNTNPEQWYIVADKNIMLSHLNFLGVLINSGNWLHLDTEHLLCALFQNDNLLN